eukprot:NODE_992_length_1173_cov_420.567616_g751_i0.p2 GENE.NODE_992_length_1173_cov_420.567616_g751_i0~~NODE_992_length_1173_cov_420.567616_g751_i0.p2  ORF type:complete len:340 (+),score=124.69 NODE_992_length_1173_cov_420.567616_g751_i0:71-1090(+)
MSALKIYGMGNPLLDISAEVGEDMLTKYELKPGNAVLAEEKHLPLYKELAVRPDVQYIPGGATLNSIRVARWMLQAKDRCSYVGCIGNDEFGNIMKSKAEAEGLNVPFMRTDEEVTGTCAVLVVGKERSLCANLAAANKFADTHMETDAVKTAIEEAGIYYIAGFFLTVSVPSIVKVGSHAAEKNKIFCMNLSAPFIIQFFGTQLAEALPYTDIIFANEDEAKEYANTNKLGTEDVKEIATKLQSIEKKNTTRPRIVIFTQGCSPTVVATAEGVKEYPVEKIDSSKIVDTNGAGDAFVGGFLAKLADGKPIEEAVLAGHYSAGIIIQHSGCTFPDVPGL